MPQQAAVSTTPTVHGLLEEALKGAIDNRCDLRLRARKDPRSVSVEALEAADDVVNDRAQALLKHRLNGDTEGVIAALHSRDPETYDRTFKLLGDPDKVGFDPEVIELLSYSYRRPTRDMDEIRAQAFEAASPPETRYEIYSGGGR